MKAFYYSIFGIHILCVVAILGMLLSQIKKSEKKLNPGVKGLVILVILALGYTNVKKPVLKNSVWATMLGLTLLNVVIAAAWK